MGVGFHFWAVERKGEKQTKQKFEIEHIGLRPTCNNGCSIILFEISAAGLYMANISFTDPQL